MIDSNHFKNATKKQNNKINLIKYFKININWIELNIVWIKGEFSRLLFNFNLKNKLNMNNELINLKKKEV